MGGVILQIPPSLCLTSHYENTNIVDLFKHHLEEFLYPRKQSLGGYIGITLSVVRPSIHVPCKRNSY
jgi:hypothetical protein